MNINQFIFPTNKILEILEPKRARIVETTLIGDEYGVGDNIEYSQRGERVVGFAYSYCRASGSPVRLTIVATSREIHLELPGSQYQDFAEWALDCDYSHGQRPPDVEAEFNRRDSVRWERRKKQEALDKARYPGLWWRRFPGALGPNAKPLTEEELKFVRTFDYCED